MIYFVPDSVADEVHERTIDTERIAGLPLCQAVLMIDAYDNYYCDGKDAGNSVPQHRIYHEDAGTGVLEVDTDSTGHWYGIVYNPANPEHARQQAQAVLHSWSPAEDDGDDEDDEAMCYDCRNLESKCTCG